MKDSCFEDTKRNKEALFLKFLTEIFQIILSHTRTIEKLLNNTFTTQNINESDSPKLTLFHQINTCIPCIVINTHTHRFISIQDKASSLLISFICSVSFSILLTHRTYKHKKNTYEILLFPFQIEMYSV